jgi:hypothetical protein
MPTKPTTSTKPRPHVDICPECRATAHAALDHVRALSQAILREAGRPLTPGDTAALTRAAARVADLAIEMASAFLLMDAIMDDEGDCSEEDAQPTATANHPTTTN